MRILLLLFFFCFSLIAEAQDVYSYMSERRFMDPTDLIGYNFRPSKKETPGDYSATKIEPGEYSFGIARNRLYVAGDEELHGMYEINNIDSEQYGFKLLLLDPRNPSVRGHLKVIVNSYGEVEALVFKKKRKANEIIFHIPKAPADLIKKEKKYYTDLREKLIEDPDSLWGQKIIPYLRIQNGSGIQDRLYEQDSTVITFEEVITIKEKKKKVKSKKKKKKKKKKGDEEVVEEMEMTDEVKEEIETASAAAPPTDEMEIVNSKTIKTYFVKVRSILKYQDGTTEDKTWTYPVKEIVELEDESARKNEERYQLAIKTTGKKEIYLYLNGDRTVSSFETEDNLYLMRGH